MLLLHKHFMSIALVVSMLPVTLVSCSKNDNATPNNGKWAEIFQTHLLIKACCLQPCMWIMCGCISKRIKVFSRET
jgi:hypothetical protein